MASRLWLVVGSLVTLALPACGGNGHGNAAGEPGGSDAAVQDRSAPEAAPDGGAPADDGGNDGGADAVPDAVPDGYLGVCDGLGFGGPMPDGGPCSVGWFSACAAGSWKVTCSCPEGTCVCSTTLPDGGEEDTTLDYAACPTCGDPTTIQPAIWKACGFPNTGW